jgi:phospholipase/carboxylesterase
MEGFWRCGLLLVLSGCGSAGGCAERPVLPPSSDPELRFEAPDATGWGRARGLRYLELLRGGATPQQPLPMVVLIHGRGDRPRPEWLEAIRLELPARVVLPQAPTPAGDGFSWFPFRLGENEPSVLARGIDEACERLAGALVALRAARPTLGKPIVSGFSQGGMLSFALALRHPELIEQAIPVAGGLPEPMWPSSPVDRTRAPPIRALHGTADPVVPFAPTQRLVEHLRARGYDATLQSFPGVGHAIAPEMLPPLQAHLTAAVASIKASAQ